VTARLARAWTAWVALWDRREDAGALALVRICVGLVLVYDLTAIWRLDLVDALYLPHPDGYATAADRLGLTGPTLWAITTLAATAIATGTLTRVACVAFVLGSAQLGHLAPDGERGIEMMMRIVVAILALSRSHARWSVDAWVRRRIGRPLAHEVPAWPRYLLLFQLIWIYVSGGLNKGGPPWFPTGGFTALANILADPHVARFDPGWLELALPVTRIATALTMLFELGAPVYLVLYHWAATPERGGRLRTFANRFRLRWLWIALGVAFHLGIALGMRLGIFPWGMLALYPVLLRPDEVARLLGRLRRRPAR
jgi:hypothetical protein